MNLDYVEGYSDNVDSNQLCSQLAFFYLCVGKVHVCAGGSIDSDTTNLLCMILGGSIALFEILHPS